VAVKVQRPKITQRVDADLRAAFRILSVVERYIDHPEVARIKSATREFAIRVHEELDFRLEGEYATEIGRNFEGNPHVRVPKVMHDYTRERVLVLEFVEGTRIDRLDAANVDVPRVVTTLVELYVQ